LAIRGQRPPPTILAPSPVKLPRNWRDLVNRPQSESELAALRRCVARGAPLGTEVWQIRTADRLGLEHTLRPRGRPRSTEEK